MSQQADQRYGAGDDDAPLSVDRWLEERFGILKDAIEITKTDDIVDSTEDLSPQQENHSPKLKPALNWVSCFSPSWQIALIMAIAVLSLSGWLYWSAIAASRPLHWGSSILVRHL